MMGKGLKVYVFEATNLQQCAALNKWIQDEDVIQITTSACGSTYGYRNFVTVVVRSENEAAQSSSSLRANG